MLYVLTRPNAPAASNTLFRGWSIAAYRSTCSRDKVRSCGTDMRVAPCPFALRSLVLTRPAPLVAPSFEVTSVLISRWLNSTPFSLPHANRFSTGTVERLIAVIFRLRESLACQPHCDSKVVHEWKTTKRCNMPHNRSSSAEDFVIDNLILPPAPVLPSTRNH